jgi:hypothetical protein
MGVGCSERVANPSEPVNDPRDQEVQVFEKKERSRSPLGRVELVLRGGCLGESSLHPRRVVGVRTRTADRLVCFLPKIPFTTRFRSLLAEFTQTALWCPLAAPPPSSFLI